jgi:hypothetical protein
MDEIEIVDYNPRWPAEFEREAGAIRLALLGLLLSCLLRNWATYIGAKTPRPTECSL